VQPRQTLQGGENFRYVLDAEPVVPPPSGAIIGRRPTGRLRIPGSEQETGVR
jgi:hypothetical protein